MERRDYHNDPALGSTDVKRLLESYSTYKYYRDNPEPESAAMAFGTLVHQSILEPMDFESQVLVADIDRRTKAGKEKLAEAKAEGKTIISEADGARIKAMTESANEAIRITGIANSPSLQIEEPFFSEHGKTPIKALCDMVTGSTIYDVKTTSGGLSDDEIGKTIRTFGYHIQAGHYANVTGREVFRFLFVQSKGPYQSRVVELSREYLELGKRKAKAAYAVFEMKLDSPVYTAEVTTIEPKAWELN